MTTTIAQGATTLTPQLLLGYASTRDSGNIIHRAIDDPSNIDVTLRPASLRSGTLRFLFLTHAEGLAAEALHSNATALTLNDTDLPGVDMSYVVDGRIELELDDETRLRWVLSVDYQEVSA